MAKHRFKTKQDGFRIAIKAHVCTACLHNQAKPFDKCPNCEAVGMREFFPSKDEHHRAAELIMMQKNGLISQLKFHPRYDLKIEGTKVCAYEPDSQYVKDGKQIIEDVKPQGSDFIDPISALKIKMFNASYKKLNLRVSIYRRY